MRNELPWLRLKIDMQSYKNISGDSGVMAYHLADTSIIVKFRDGGTYVYDYTNTGTFQVETMKRLAEQGKGLATYINKYVRESYARKIAWEII